jgi:virulence-associated protein VapD
MITNVLCFNENSSIRKVVPFIFVLAFSADGLSANFGGWSPSYTSGSSDRSGRSGRCSNVPAEVVRVARGMVDLRRNCSTLSFQSSTSKPVMVADLSNDDGNFFVFDSNGQCERVITSNSWGHGGAGPRSDVDPEPCSRGRSHMNPAGLHVTDANHNTDKYPRGTALLMRGLDGQNSEGRGILIHGGHPSATSSSIGCNAMSDSDFAYCRDNAGSGALVYNYFGSNRPNDPSCAAGYRANGGLPSCSELGGSLLPPSPSSPRGGGDHMVKSYEDPLDYFFIPKIAKLFKIDSAEALGIVEYPIKAGTGIEVIKFDPELKLYEVLMVNQTGVGPNYADVKDLMKALGFNKSQVDRYKKSPRDLFGVQFNLQTALELQNFSQIVARFPKYKLVEMKKEWDNKKRIERESKKRAPASKQGSE